MRKIIKIGESKTDDSKISEAEKFKSVVRYFLPSLLLEHFDITDVSEKETEDTNEKYLQIDLEEKNKIPAGYESSEYESKGFYNVKLIQDFPVRGKAVFLAIKRRRWRHKIEQKEIHNDYSFIADGSKFTKELSDFLKDTVREP